MLAMAQMIYPLHRNHERAQFYLENEKAEIRRELQTVNRQRQERAERLSQLQQRHERLTNLRSQLAAQLPSDSPSPVSDLVPVAFTGAETDDSLQVDELTLDADEVPERLAQVDRELASVAVLLAQETEEAAAETSEATRLEGRLAFLEEAEQWEH